MSGTEVPAGHTDVEVCDVDGRRVLLEFEKATERADVASARHTGEEFLLSRSLFRRLTDGEIADQDFLKLTHPNRWHYDVLRGLDYLRAAGFHDATPSKETAS